MGEEAAAPDQERVNAVHAGDPQGAERKPRLEVHPAEHRSQSQDRRDRRENELEVDERRLGERLRPDERDHPLSLELLVTEDRSGLAEEVLEEPTRVAGASRTTGAY